MIESDFEKSSFCPLQLYLKYLDADKMERRQQKIYLKYLETDKMGAQVCCWNVPFGLLAPEMILSSHSSLGPTSFYSRGRPASKSNNGTIFFYCTFNEIYLLHNVLLCFLLTFMELPVRENGWGISQIPAGDGRSGPEINKPSLPCLEPRSCPEN